VPLILLVVLIFFLIFGINRRVFRILLVIPVTGLLFNLLLIYFFGLKELQDEQREFLKKMDKYMKERHLRLAITGGGPGSDYGWDGLLALVPGNARKGDQMAILKGCSTPVLLREHNDGYQVIGMVYLEKAMRGELIAWPPEHWKECKLY